MKKILKICWIRKCIKSYDWIDYLGFNFIDTSKRKITKEKAKEIITPEKVVRIWVFWKYENKKWQNLDYNYLDEIIKLAKETNMNWLQIHWLCDFAYLKKEGFFIIHSIFYEDIGYLKEDSNIDLYIIDWANPWSWKSYDYEILKNVSIKKPFLIAWWINENNLNEILLKLPNLVWIDIASWVDNWKNICWRKIKRILKILNWANIEG